MQRGNPVVNQRHSVADEFMEVAVTRQGVEADIEMTGNCGAKQTIDGEVRGSHHTDDPESHERLTWAAFDRGFSQRDLTKHSLLQSNMPRLARSIPDALKRATG